jgi:hypothetical protein
MSLDFEKYRHHVDRFDLSEEQKDELLLTVWRLVEIFVDKSFSGRDSQSIRCEDTELSGQEQLEPLEYDDIPGRTNPRTGRFEL